MRISTKGRYGLRAMVDMAINASEGPMPLRVIAERQGISDSYLEQVFTSLRKNGLVNASRGAQGGYELSRSATEISVGDILRSLEGPLAPVHCVEPNSKPCDNQKNCITYSFWAELRDKIDDLVDQTTLQNLADRSTKNQGTYHI